jgi:hypothetical protein
MVLLLPAARSSAQGTIEEVQACMRANLPERSSVQAVELRLRDRTGSERVLAGEILWKRLPEDRRWLLFLDEPQHVRGSAYLMIENGAREEMWVHLPELAKVRRIQSNTVAGSLFGSDFSYEDVKFLQRIAFQAEAQRLPDVVEDGRKLYAVQTTPAPGEGSAYEKVVAFVDSSSCVPLRMEFYAKGGAMVKKLDVDPGSLSQEGRGWVPRRIVIQDLESESRTTLAVSSVWLDVDLEDPLFTVIQLEKGLSAKLGQIVKRLPAEPGGTH